MSLNNIIFIKGAGGLGRPLPGKDYISALLFYVANGSLPSGFSITNRTKQIFSVVDAENAGILADYSDETKATGVYTVSAVGANGDTLALNFTEPDGTVVTLGTYVKSASETTVALIGTAIAALINSGTYIHGYTATNAGAAVTVVARPGLGIYPNTGTPLSATISGTIAGSVTTAFTGGVASLQAVWHYHISEYFRIQPKGFLWLSFYPVPTTYNFVEIRTIQEFTNGAIRQIGVYLDTIAYNAVHTTAVQAICNILDDLKMPLSVLFAPNIAAVTDIATLTDLSTFKNNKVSVVIGQDATGKGAALYSAVGKSITNLGQTLGAVALSAVHEDIAWVARFDVSNGIETEGIAFANGMKFTDASVTATLLDAIDLKRYIFLRKFPNIAGSYFNDSHTAISQSSDYAYIENNRVIDKAIRGIDNSLTPSIASPLLLNANGTLANSTIAYLESQAVVNTDQMIRDGEASAIEVFIDPSQNVLTTSELKITCTIVPVGVARKIIVNIGYKTSI